MKLIKASCQGAGLLTLKSDESWRCENWHYKFACYAAGESLTSCRTPRLIEAVYHPDSSSEGLRMVVVVVSVAAFLFLGFIYTLV